MLKTLKSYRAIILARTYSAVTRQMDRATELFKPYKNVETL